MNQHNLSPEDNLLKLIKNKKTNTEIQAFNSGTIENKVSKLNISFSLAAINKFLIYALLACIILFFSSLIFLKIPQNMNSLKLDLKQENLNLATKEVADFSQYLSNFDKKDLFLNSNNLEERTRDDSSESSGNIDTTDIIKDINLLGIVSGQNPQAVIEDKKTQKTYFLNQGDSFGQTRVLEIKEGKVVLDYKGKNFELFL